MDLARSKNNPKVLKLLEGNQNLLEVVNCSWLQLTF